MVPLVRRRHYTEDERVYLRTCRKIAAEEIARSGFTEAAKQAAVEHINARFPYANPTGIKDIVRSSVDGLFQELSYAERGPCSVTNKRYLPS